MRYGTLYSSSLAQLLAHQARTIPLLLILIFGVTSALAQDACPVFTSDLLDQAARCEGQGVNTLCVGKEPAAVGFSRGTADFETGDLLALDSLMRVETQNDTSENTGLAIMTTDAGLTTNPVTMTLYGGATLETGIGITTLDLPTIVIANKEDYDLNLREGPATTYNTVGLIPAGTQLWADGRSPDNQWLRVRTETGVAWVSVTLVQIEGDINTLLALETLYTAPMQIMRLQTADCGGLMLQRQGTERVHVQINGADLAFEAATVIAQANAEDGLQIHVLDGSVRLVAAGQTMDVASGQSATIAIDTALLPTGTPVLQERYPFAAITSAPLPLIATDSMMCIAGITTAEALTPYSGPGESYTALRALDGQSHYTVTGYANDSSAQVWWRLDDNQWIPQSRVQTLGQCTAVAEVAPPSPDMLTVLPGSPLAPGQKTIYQAESGADVMTGTCTGSPLAICSHPVAMWPNGDGSFSWRGQEPIDYRLSPAGESSYSYSGRNFSENANLLLNLSFTTSTTWQMTMTTIYDNDPLCNHTFYYTATAR
jgi:uncharacterized protein YraI